MIIPIFKALKFRLVLLTAIVLITSSFNKSENFLEKQLKFERVRNAAESKLKNIENQLNKHHLKTNNFKMLIVAYKDLDELEIYVKNKNEISYKPYKTFEVCSRSGDLGPKNKQGDGQVPEGIYYINRFNPSSNYFLSLGLNYPNKSDLIRSKTKFPGGDIFIHGACVSLGCLPMTDEQIKEIYMLSVLSKNNGQEAIPVYIFPFKMNDESMDRYREKFDANEQVIDFWDNLKTAYILFNKNKREIKYQVQKDGKYKFYN
jgi:murein L,D-transpeptidase YafK